MGDESTGDQRIVDEGGADEDGDGCDGGYVSSLPPIGAGGLRLLAQALVARLDPDGVEPLDERAPRKRSLTFGAPENGLVPIRGHLLPDVAGQPQRLFDALLSPQSGTRGPTFVEDDESTTPGRHPGGS